jgi:hypothetical protein
MSSIGVIVGELQSSNDGDPDRQPALRRGLEAMMSIPHIVNM